MNPETTAAIFNSLCIAGGALVGFGSIAILQIATIERSERKRQKQIENDLQTFELVVPTPVDGAYVEKVREQTLGTPIVKPRITWDQIKFPGKK